MRSIEKLLCLTVLGLAGCAAEVSEPTGTTEAALSATDPYRWETNPVAHGPAVVKDGPYVSQPNKMAGQVDPDALGVDVLELRPTFIQFSGISPLWSADNVCEPCTR